jgi:hypothetical protein
MTCSAGLIAIYSGGVVLAALFHGARWLLQEVAARHARAAAAEGSRAREIHRPRPARPVGIIVSVSIGGSQP